MKPLKTTVFLKEMVNYFYSNVMDRVNMIRIVNKIDHFLKIDDEKMRNLEQAVINEFSKKINWSWVDQWSSWRAKTGIPTEESRRLIIVCSLINVNVFMVFFCYLMAFHWGILSKNIMRMLFKLKKDSFCILQNLFNFI